MAKAKDVKGKKRGRKDRDPSGPTRTTTYRVSPAGIEGIQTLSDRLDLRSQAASIELANCQFLGMLERLDAQPPLDPEQLRLVAIAVEAAGLVPRAIGAKASYVILLNAAVSAAETALVPSQCSAKMFGELVEVVKGFGPAEALWAIGQAIQG